MAQDKCVRILMVNSNDNETEIWARTLSPLFSVTCVTGARDAIRQVEEHDVLLLDWHLNDHVATTVLDAWVENNGGPACVINGNDVYETQCLLSQGVHHALRRPVEVSVLISVLLRYRDHVMTQREIIVIRQQLRKLRDAIIVLAIMLAATAGPTILPRIMSMLGG